MTDVVLAMNIAEDKTEKMKAKSQALDEMIDSGVLTDYTSSKDDIEKELEESSVKDSVEEELAKLKAEKARKKKQTVEYEEEQAAQQ
jgi:phage shock protein A